MVISDCKVTTRIKSVRETVLLVTMLFGSFLMSKTTALMPALLYGRHASQLGHELRRNFGRTTTRLYVDIDEEGRRVRRRSGRDNDQASSGGWDDFDPVAPTRSSSKSGGSDGGWDDFDPFGDDAPRRSKPSRSRNAPRGDSRGSRDRGPPNRGGGGGRERGGPPRGRNNYRKENGADDRKINMKALEGAGFIHLYGLSSVLNALETNRRDFERIEDAIDLESLAGEDLEHEEKQRQRKPEAQFSPWLFVQERGGQGNRRSTDKAIAAEEVERLAGERQIPIANVDKGILNALSGNRPHQGYVLRCGKLYFESLPRIPHPKDDPEAPKLWLVLDEVVDPQNLGALLRSAYFLGGSSIGVMVCAKNSAPPTPVVSAASAGALELLDIHSTTNLPRTLNAARDEGFRIIGASVSSYDPDVPVWDLQSLESDDGRPTLLVLGSEGHGLRNLVARACTDFVKIPGGGGETAGEAGVDSLNVSVTGGILLWHLMQGALQK